MSRSLSLDLPDDRKLVELCYGYGDDMELSGGSFYFICPKAWSPFHVQRHIFERGQAVTLDQWPHGYPLEFSDFVHELPQLLLPEVEVVKIDAEYGGTINPRVTIFDPDDMEDEE